MASKTSPQKKAFLASILPNPIFRWALIAATVIFFLILVAFWLFPSNEMVLALKNIQNEIGAILIAIVTAIGAFVSIQEKTIDPGPEVMEVTESELFNGLEQRTLKYTDAMMQGNDVRELQMALAKRGYSLTIDGIFGEETEKTVIQAQISFGITPDGIVGPITRARLRLLFDQQKNLQE